MNKRGITLIELIIVVAIIGILAMIGVPAYIGQQKRAARVEAFTNLETLRLLEEQYFAENGCYYRDEEDNNRCKNKIISGVDNIKKFLRGFRPGNSLNFDYQIETTGDPPASCFVATAIGKPGTRVDGDKFTINCRNERNF